MADTPRVTVPEAIEALKHCVENEKAHWSLSEICDPCVDVPVKYLRAAVEALSAAPAPEGGAVKALQRLRALRDQARNGTAVSDPDEYDADEIDAILSVIAPAPAALSPEAPAREWSTDDMRELVTDEQVRWLVSATDVAQGRARLKDILNALTPAMKPQHRTGNASLCVWPTRLAMRRVSRTATACLTGSPAKKDGANMRRSFPPSPRFRLGCRFRPLTTDVAVAVPSIRRMTADDRRQA